MSYNNDIKKINKKRKKKRNGMEIEDYAKEHNIEVDINLEFEDNTENIEINHKKTYYSNYQSNINIIKKNDQNKIKKNDYKENKLIKKEFEVDDGLYNSSSSLNLVFKTRESTSTNNSSFDENKINNNEKNDLKKKNDVNENKNIKITNTFYIPKAYKGNNNITQINNYKISPYYVNNNFNRNYFINNNSYIYNYNYIMLINYNNMLKNNYNIYCDKLQKNNNNLKEIEKEIIALENKSLLDMFLSSQTTEVINYIKSKNKNLISNNNNNEKEKPEHPYFYTNHNEETQIKNVLYLIESIFNDDNLKKDFNLLIILNRDGYASLKMLEKHPQVNSCKVTESHLKRVFSEHRDNEITETVETFDDILIRNKRWVKIKKEINNDIEQIKENCLNSIKEKKEIEMKNLKEKKRNYLNIKGDILYQYKVNNNNIQQKINQIRINLNNIYKYTNYTNYNYNFNNIYNNNNVYNNFYSNNLRY